VNTVEDRLRAAGRSVSEQVTSLPELRLAPGRAPSRRAPFWRARFGQVRFRQARFRQARGGRWWAAWGAPLTAVGLVAAVAIALVVVRDTGTGGATARAGGQAGSARPGPAGPDASAGQVPRYYIAVQADDTAVIGDLRTGAVAETIKPAAGHTIAGVAGAADASTFVVDMPEESPPRGSHQFFVYRAAKAGAAPVRRSALTLTPYPSGQLMLGLALSPDGTSLAVLTVEAAPGQFVLRVYSAATGILQHLWAFDAPQVVDAGGSDNSDSLTWSGDSIAFQPSPALGADKVAVSVVMVNASHPVSYPKSSSRVVSVQATGLGCDVMLLSQDGKTIICGARSDSCGVMSGGTAHPGITEYSAQTGKLVGVLYAYGGRCAWGITDLFWSNASGSAVVADTTLGTGDASDSPTEQVAGLYTAHGITSLPLHLRVTGDFVLGGWNPAAF
jgi:hypothetical protein